MLEQEAQAYIVRIQGNAVFNGLTLFRNLYFIV